MAGLASALSSLFMYGPEGGRYDGGKSRYSRISIAGIDPTDPSKIFGSLTERTFQYWPESISDSIDLGWNFKDIPGASHSLAQWSSNGGRTISFEVPLHRFTRPLSTRTSQEKVRDVIGDSGPNADSAHNVDIRNEIQYLRGYCYPTYAEIGGIKGALSPPVGILNVPNLGLNESGGDAIFVIMTSCEVNYMLCFPDGTPRRANVSLSFKQIVQKDKKVTYKGWPDQYKIEDDEKLAKGGGHSIVNLGIGSVS